MLLSTIQLFPGESKCHNRPKKNILLCSVGTVHFEDKVVD